MLPQLVCLTGDNDTDLSDDTEIGDTEEMGMWPFPTKKTIAPIVPVSRPAISTVSPIRAPLIIGGAAFAAGFIVGYMLHRKLSKRRK